METAIFGGGCFWCTEAIFQKLKGVQTVTSGYAGGTVANPSYERVSMGSTGHAEVIKIEFDPNIISYEDLLDIFWHVHDPTTLNKQGNDVGTQYRSIILYTSEDQRRKAERSLSKMSQSGEFSKPIVTEIKQLDTFYDAETYHKNYFENNTLQPYCQVVIAPKLAHFLEKYSSKVK
jgi:peptide-methionine (S)-S-oxide reductase